MALRTCKGCGNRVDKWAKECPHCGRPDDSGVLLRWMSNLILGSMALAVFWMIVSGGT